MPEYPRSKRNYSSVHDSPRHSAFGKKSQRIRTISDGPGHTVSLFVSFPANTQLKTMPTLREIIELQFYVIDFVLIIMMIFEFGIGADCHSSITDFRCPVHACHIKKFETDRELGYYRSPDFTLLEIEIECTSSHLKQQTSSSHCI